MKQLNFAIIVSGGTGQRIGGQKPKQFIEIDGKSILQYSIEAFLKHTQIDGVVVVSHSKYLLLTEEVTKAINTSKEIKIASGGSHRYLSVLEGLKLAKTIDPNANVLIHDAVRPNISQKIITDVIEALKKHDFVSTAVPVTDTIYIKENNKLTVPNRSNLYAAQTPQAFKLKDILEASLMLKADNAFIPTDDVSVFLNAFPNKKIHIVEGSTDNIKITYKADIEWFKQKLNAK